MNTKKIQTEPQKSDLIVSNPKNPNLTRFYSKFPIGYPPRKQGLCLAKVKTKLRNLVLKGLVLKSVF